MGGMDHLLFLQPLEGDSIFGSTVENLHAESIADFQILRKRNVKRRTHDFMLITEMELHMKG